MTLTVTAVADTTPPSFSSATSANAIEEGSGSNQTVYNAQASDDSGTVSYSIKANSGDAQAFSIDSSSGEVTLLENPDYTQHDSYRFTVIASDAGGNTAEHTITLPILSIDRTGPAIDSITLSSNDAPNSYLAAGDTITATLRMSEVTQVSGTPQLNLSIGSESKTADYQSGSGSRELVFSYSIEADLNDSDGISINANSLSSNGASLTDAAGNNATLTHGEVEADSNYKVDSSAPDARLIATSSNQHQADNDTANSYLHDKAAQIISTANHDLVIWQAQKSDGHYALQVQQLNTDGSSNGSPLTLDKNTSNSNNTGQALAVTQLSNDGSFAATWEQLLNNLGEREILVQRFDADGNATGSTFQTSAYASPVSSLNGPPQISSIGSDGSYVVVWDQYTRALKDQFDLAPREIQVQSFDKDGNASGNTTSLSIAADRVNADFSPSVINIGDSGEFAVAWQAKDAQGMSIIQLQKFGSNGQKSGDAMTLEVPESSLTSQNNKPPTLTAIESDGGFVASWTGTFSNSSFNNAVLIQKFDNNGSPTTNAPVMLQTNQAGGDNQPVVAGLTNGEFAVAWQGSNSANGHNIFVQTFFANGTASSSQPLQLDINDVPAVNADNSNPQLLALADGGFVVAWQGKDSPSNHGDSSIYLQQFDSNGSSSGLAQVMLEANGMTNGNDSRPQLAPLGNQGDYLVSWQGQDRSGVEGVFSQKIQADGTPAVTEINRLVAQPGESVHASSSDSGTLYLIHEQHTISTLSDIQNMSASNTLTEIPVTQADSEVTLQLPQSLVPGEYHLYAADSAGNVAPSSQSVIVSGINNVTVSGAQGAIDNVLGSGATLMLTATLNGEASINSPSSDPLTLDIMLGDKIVAADYQSSSNNNGNTEILFAYQIEKNQVDTDGVSIMGDSLRGGSITLDGNELPRYFSYVDDDNSLLIDGEAPQALLISNEIIGLGDEVQVSSGENATIYLINSEIDFTAIEQYDELAASNQAAQVSVVGGISEAIDTTALELGNYQLYASDSLSNLSDASDIEVTIQPKANVVFDLVAGVSSAHSDRSFDANTSYNIYVRVDSDTQTLSSDGNGPNNSSWGSWSGAENLGSDDRLVLVGNGSAIQDKTQQSVTAAVWNSQGYFWTQASKADSFAAKFTGSGQFARQWNNHSSQLDLWSGKWSSPNNNASFSMNDIYLTDMPANILTSQGLA